MIFYNFIKQALQKNIPKWNYYTQDNNIDILHLPSLSKEFIDTYFKNGQKDFSVLNLDENMPRLSEFRAIHTVSSFFLGVQLASWLNELTLKCDNQEFDFSYIWFLTCLFHDYGYAIEETKTPKSHINKSKIKLTIHSPMYLEKVKKQYNITCSPYQGLNNKSTVNSKNTGILSYKENLLKYLTANAPSLKNGITLGDRDNTYTVNNFTYSASLTAKYFNYCMNELDFPVYNHGIIGGLLFYDRMLKNYIYCYSCLKPDERPNF